MTKTYKEIVAIDNPIGNLYRKRHVLVLLVTPEGRFVLCKKKNFYPDHIARMLGGGIGENEDPKIAAMREIKEEIDVDIPLDEFKPLCTVETQADTAEGPMAMTTYIFSAKIDNVETLKAGDDISGIESYSLEEYKALVDEMRRLTGEYVTDKFSFKWADWGKIYAPIHDFALQEYR